MLYLEYFTELNEVLTSFNNGSSTEVEAKQEIEELNERARRSDNMKLRSSLKDPNEEVRKMKEFIEFEKQHQISEEEEQEEDSYSYSYYEEEESYEEVEEPDPSYEDAPETQRDSQSESSYSSY